MVALALVAATALISLAMAVRPFSPDANSPPRVAETHHPTDAPSRPPLHDSWPNLFGPGHDNRSADAISVDWPNDGPPEQWRIAVGAGYSSPIIVDDCAVVLHRLGDEELVSCIDVQSAQTLWEFRYPTTFVCGSHYTHGPYSTPASDGSRLVTLGAQGQLHCLQLATGDLLWQCDTAAEFDVRPDVFGAGHSPLIWGDLVILNVGGDVPDSGIIAFDLSDGRLRWRSTSHGPSFATPVPIMLHGRKRVLVLTGDGLVLLDPRDGRVLDEFPYTSRIPDAYNAVTPVVSNDLVLISVYGAGSACLRVAPDERFAEVWNDKRTLTSQYNPLLVQDGFVYGLHSVDRSFRCVELQTGELQWRWKSDLARSTQLIAGDHILMFGEFGELGAIDLDPRVCTERALTSRTLFDGERCFSAPALSQGRLLLRNEKELACFDLSP